MSPRWLATERRTYSSGSSRSAVEQRQRSGVGSRCERAQPRAPGQPRAAALGGEPPQVHVGAARPRLSSRASASSRVARDERAHGELRRRVVRQHREGVEGGARDGSRPACSTHVGSGQAGPARQLAGSSAARHTSVRGRGERRAGSAAAERARRGAPPAPSAPARRGRPAPRGSKALARRAPRRRSRERGARCARPSPASSSSLKRPAPRPSGGSRLLLVALHACPRRAGSRRRGRARRCGAPRAGAAGPTSGRAPRRAPRSARAPPALRPSWSPPRRSSSCSSATRRSMWPRIVSSSMGLLSGQRPLEGDLVDEAPAPRLAGLAPSCIDGVLGRARRAGWRAGSASCRSSPRARTSGTRAGAPSARRWRGSPRSPATCSRPLDLRSGRGACTVCTSSMHASATANGVPCTAALGLRVDPLSWRWR